jgi:hypothetical protein
MLLNVIRLKSIEAIFMIKFSNDLLNSWMNRSISAGRVGERRQPHALQLSRDRKAPSRNKRSS